MEKGASDLAQSFFDKVGAKAVHRQRKSDDLRVARAYGAPISNQTDKITKEDIGTGAGVFEGELRGCTQARLKVSHEEELDRKICLILYEPNVGDSGYSPLEQGKRRGYTKEGPDHVLRIERVVRQPQDHLLLIGGSGAGWAMLSKFGCKDEKI